MKKKMNCFFVLLLRRKGSRGTFGEQLGNNGNNGNIRGTSALFPQTHCAATKEQKNIGHTRLMP